MKYWASKNANNDFERDFHKLINNSVFDKTMQNVRKDWDINLLSNDKRGHDLIPELNCYSTKWSTKWFTERLLATEMRKVKVSLKNFVYLVFSILDTGKI